MMRELGETASKATEKFRSDKKNIPWDDIINVRHRLTYAYFDINLDIVWQTVRADLTEPIKALECIIPPEFFVYPSHPFIPTKI